ncbi:MAG: 3-oxoacyl-ACP synthase [Bdellovibrio sp. CG12_big_fil_rev_8_21_14_0_65_39_13]|nr:ketoacyl-ACP synthase III [Bdellovibrionales bacterium]PIP94667.1 MAG: 3-oxoacyl-ACP synthase [Bdellovibrio sp. CG22_combo_CG10-13_8_21_14_all_39_27]PIQ59787.1 MAG: 3-oxoacyl-ACP synthase [Bdellovibrio sp. CG12_big_fil_rev_8_21_14_0_65_39_13]PIR36185.1 MAG: 3-oxoacyl-ACP synthase [Bdellovibrio sp. CG11_big_fil_rev_8_21_14_0_20_39_38]PJB52629.1 MAG: 3-oxoacyl-ACP synthase [Bdellovibrio sp. CG_4_9_14_3_um_filter_39_7]
MTEIKTKILGTGIYLPKKVVTNLDLEKVIDTSDQWIFERTGIRARRICSTEGGEWPTDMAMHASWKALETARLQPNDIDMIIFASVTPDQKLPNSASLLQQKLGITNNCACMDIAVACSGFVYGVNMANSFIKTGMAKNVLVVGSEMLSREVDWNDRTICILFGDGCGVGIVGRSEEGDESQILSTHLGSDGSGKEFFNQPVGGAVEPITETHIKEGTHFMRMKGKEMFKVATRTLADNAKIVLERAGMTLDQVDWVVPHQANIRIIETTANLIGISMDKVIVNIENYGNTSAATVPIAFHEAIESGKIKRGDVVILDAFGAGLTFGATLLRY